MLVLCLIGLQSVFAQSREVSGVVTSADDGMSIPGVSVMVKGTTIGTSTDFDGKYTISVPADGEFLVFSFVGMKPIEMPISSSTINVVMESDAIGMEEVMVVAYGTAKRSSFTGSATVVKAEKLEKRKTTELTKALEGEVAGVQIINSSGQPGETAKIRIRGIGSLNASSEPLYVLDGIPFGGDLSSIDTRDIESFTVLKDASAAALYGSRAANGVVLIQTKKGKVGKSKIDVNVDLGASFRLLPYYETTTSAKEYYELSWEALRNSKQYAASGAMTADAAAAWASENLVSELGGYNLYNVEDNVLVGTNGQFNSSAKRMINDSWKDEMMRTGLKKSIGISMRGGKDNTTYYTSINYLNDEGYVKESSFDRLSTVVNLDHKVKSWLKTSNKLSYSYYKMTNPVSEASTAANNAFYFVNNIPPIYPVFVYDENYNKVIDENGDLLYDYSDGSTDLSRRFGNFINPARSYELDERFTEINQVTANSYLEATFLENFKFSSRIGVTYSNSLDARQQNSLYGDGKGKGSVSRTTNSKLTYTWNQILNWNKQFGDHSLSAMVGHEVYSYERKYQYGYKSGTLKEHTPEFSNAIKLETLNSDTYERSMESYFGQLIYDYNSKYFLKGSYRRDGSSRFPNDRWGNFWSVGGSWKVSDEDFMADFDFINLLKVKASYGVSGNENIDSSYPAYDIYNVANLNDSMALEFDTKGNPNLSWESNSNFNTGIEFDLWNKRFSGAIEYYVRNTTDMLYARDVASSLGYDEIFVNDLDMRNSGIEFSFSYTPISNDDHEFTVSVNGAHYKNEITKMAADPSTGEPAEFIRNGTFGYEKGRSIYDRYVKKYAGVNATTGESEWWKAVDSDSKSISDLNKQTKPTVGEYTWEKTTDYDEATRTFVGNTAIPDLQGGFSLYYRYKGFDIDVRCIYQIGGKAYDGIYADLMNSSRAVGKGIYHKDILKRWTPTNTNTNVARLTSDLDKNVSSQSDRWLTDASYLGLSNVRLGYTFSPEFCDRLSLDAVSVYASGNNLYTFTKEKDFIQIHLQQEVQMNIDILH